MTNILVVYLFLLFSFLILLLFNGILLSLLLLPIILYSIIALPINSHSTSLKTSSGNLQPSTCFSNQSNRIKTPHPNNTFEEEESGKLDTRNHILMWFAKQPSSLLHVTYIKLKKNRQIFSVDSVCISLKASTYKEKNGKEGV